MLTAWRYYWRTARGYRLRPWQSPYLRWRLETFFGGEAGRMDAREFFRVLWRERARLRRFLAWVAEREREQKRRGSGG